jgi:hypothetical protein
MMPEKNDSYGFLGTAIPSAKFPSPGTTVSGVICDDPVQTQQTTPSGDLKTWESGDPMMQLVVTIQTAERDPEIDDDDGKRRVFVKGQMRKALGDAVRHSGKKGLDVGGTLTVTYTADGERTNPAFSPPKQYEIVYEPPTSDSAEFLGTAVAGSGNGAASASTAKDAGVAQSTAAIPAGMTPDVWKTLSPEAQQALQNLASK